MESLEQGEYVEVRFRKGSDLLVVCGTLEGETSDHLFVQKIDKIDLLEQHEFDGWKIKKEDIDASRVL